MLPIVRMEFGPRALGSRSIIADARRVDMQKNLNLKIKFREGFRPFAPAVLEDKVHEYFSVEEGESLPYMLITAFVRSEKKILQEDGGPFNNIPIEKQIGMKRSSIPAVTHVDDSARLQTVNAVQSPHFYRLLQEFYALTQCPVIINTSFNIRGEPIVRTPYEAYRCFMRTDMDYLVLGNYLLAKKDQPFFDDKSDFLSDYDD